MSAAPWSDQNVPLLSGLFGLFQSDAGGRQSTSQIWTDLRVAAGTWQYQAQGSGETPSIAQLEEAGRQVLSNAGIGIQQVNQYRALAGQWRSAHENLQTADPEQQLTSSMVFVPPWAQTTGGEVQSRYRLRVNWQVSDYDGVQSTAWGTYELTPPLTSLQDALDDAYQAVNKPVGSQNWTDWTTAEPIDYHIEQV